MNKAIKRRGGLLMTLMTVLLLWAVQAQAVIDGISGTPGTPTFNLVAKQDFISAPDGDSILMWGYADGANRMQYPGPTLIVNEGDMVTVTLVNQLPPAHVQNVSIVFPGQVVTATGGTAGMLTQEAPPGGSIFVTYQFEATHPGTYIYRLEARGQQLTQKVVLVR